MPLSRIAGEGGTRREAMGGGGCTFKTPHPSASSRSQRYSMLIDNGVVKQLNVEKAGQFEVSSADAMLKGL